jgi:hypothetical protein
MPSLKVAASRLFAAVNTMFEYVRRKEPSAEQPRSRSAEAIRPYKVLVDDNFHYIDESERYTHGQFDTLEAAIAACKRIVDASLDEEFRPGITAERLLSRYTSFGLDPFVVGADVGSVPFSAWEYAKARCPEIVQAKS